MLESLFKFQIYKLIAFENDMSKQSEDNHYRRDGCPVKNAVLF